MESKRERNEVDKLREIETFVQVVDFRSFSKVALTQNVTPVMIGRRISQLEERLGGKLFMRSTRSLVLTKAGESFLVDARRILSQTEEAERLVAQARIKATGHLLVSVAANFGRRHVVPHLQRFMESNPDVKISLNLSDQVFDILRGGYDLAIRIGALPDPSLTAVNLARNPLQFYASPQYLKRFGTPSTPDQLLQHNCLTFNRQGGQQDGWLVRDGDRTITLRVSGNLSCSDGATLCQWAASGLGIAQLPQTSAAPLHVNGKLVTILEDFVSLDRYLMIVYPRQRNLPAKSALFIEFLKSVYNQPGYWSRPYLPLANMFSPPEVRRVTGEPS